MITFHSFIKVFSTSRDLGTKLELIGSSHIDVSLSFIFLTSVYLWLKRLKARLFKTQVVPREFPVKNTWENTICLETNAA